MIIFIYMKVLERTTATLFIVLNKQYIELLF